MKMNGNDLSYMPIGLQERIESCGQCPFISVRSCFGSGFCLWQDSWVNLSAASCDELYYVLNHIDDDYEEN